MSSRRVEARRFWDFLGIDHRLRHAAQCTLDLFGAWAVGPAVVNRLQVLDGPICFRLTLLTAASHVTIIMVMAKKSPFTLVYDPEAVTHLDAIELKYHSLIRQTIEEQLQFEPETPTRNRKPLDRPIMLGANWELRLGPGNCFRVFYRVDRELWQVRILGIGVKERNRLFLVGVEVKL